MTNKLNKSWFVVELEILKFDNYYFSKLNTIFLICEAVLDDKHCYGAPFVYYNYTNDIYTDSIVIII